MLKERRYFELDQTISLLLNKDWMYEPHTKYACAQVLIGSIVMNTVNGKAILINTVEAYGRKKTIVIHKELSMSGNSSIITVIPAYPNIWPCNQPIKDGSNFVIGTQTYSFLVTSVIHLDRQEE
ncbi:hypothetical protein INT48_002359 [Thamnidium elegans]|uniref:Uncharacterized protein n=1 Tax=Thamnidium elegans TaxID=101142 RepID=A0A8H7SSL7_9FUNG|nr:hypothetical protein INT48_002359 [Thamnidium elegans]